MAVLFTIIAIVQAIILIPVPEKVGIVIDETKVEEYLEDHLERVLEADETTETIDGN